MNRENILKTATAVMALMCIAACDSKPSLTMPEVNEANCSTEALKALAKRVPEKDLRNFGSKCARGGTYTFGGKPAK